MGKIYLHKDIELKWQKKWEKEGVYSPDMENPKNPYYNLMMFPYPSAEGLHVGNMYAFTGTDLYGRFMRMRGHDVFEPIGLDGFGIHSENYALKVGRHPKEQAVIAEQNFYRQLRSIGNGFDWTRTVETYNPDYYKWTQWLFIQMFKNGLAYRKKAEVNWCPSCKTVLSDEQVIQGMCERCGSNVEKREFEQWFFRITKYAQRLLDNIELLNWTEKVKIAQKNWIGKSSGAEVSFEIDKKYHFVLLHGFGGSPDRNFFPWLKIELEKRGHTVNINSLPNSEMPKEQEQVDFVLKNCKFDESTILYGHSLGSVVAMKVLEKLDTKINSLILSGTFAKPIFKDHPRPFEKSFLWDFNVEKIQENAGEIIVLHDSHDCAVPYSQAKNVSEMLNSEFRVVKAVEEHFDAQIEPTVLDVLVPSLKVFTTRPDTLFGATFMVVSPEHSIVKSIIHSSDKAGHASTSEISKYIIEAGKKSDQDRMNQDKEKTGVFSGMYVINPVNNEKIPIWIADYVLMGYGTGAIMAVPAHDERDFAFAKKYRLPISQVVMPENGIKKENEERRDGGALATELGYDGINDKNRLEPSAFSGNGILMNSGEWDGLEMPKQMNTIIDSLEKKGIGKRQANYHLRDWLISRQRYWGPPIPMMYCEACSQVGKGEREDMPGWYSVAENDLPVSLPDVTDWKPMGTGKAPLANHPEFFEIKCPGCGEEATRETDVSDTFLDSAWYFLRYTSTDIKQKAFEGSRVEKWLPVHSYIGGAEHSVLHLLYSRFITMVLKDLGLINFEEPFARFFAHGLIIKDGAKMSKSKGNVVIPDQYIAKYGADTLRLYLMFLGPFSDGGDFRDSGIEGMNRFVKRAWKLLSTDFTVKSQESPLSKDRLYMLHKTVKKVSEDINSLSYNTAIASLMEWMNFLTEEIRAKKSELMPDEKIVFIKLLAPFAPHLTEELWQDVVDNEEGSKKSKISLFKSVHHASWPEWDEKYLVQEVLNIAVQVNGKTRAVISIGLDDIKNEDSVKALALKNEKIIEWTKSGGGVKKIIYVPGKIINFVV